MAAQARGQPDALDLGATEGDGADIGLEDDLVVLDDHVCVLPVDQGQQGGAVGVAAAGVGRVTDLRREHVRCRRHDEVDLVGRRGADPRVELDPEVGRAGHGAHQWLLRPHGACGPP